MLLELLYSAFAIIGIVTVAFVIVIHIGHALSGTSPYDY